jgi:hypothetical protein
VGIRKSSRFAEKYFTCAIYQSASSTASASSSAENAIRKRIGKGRCVRFLAGTSARLILTKLTN